jgi:hypothetical protein
MVLITCPECRKDISDQAPACIHCGYPLRAATPAQEPEWETCQIEWSNAETFMGLPKTQRFWAAAVSPIVGQYSAADSSAFKQGWSTTNTLNFLGKVSDFNPKADDKASLRAHAEVIDQLVKEGWEPTGLKGHHWWQDRFRRRARRSRPTNTDLYLYDDQNSTVFRCLIPAGTEITITEVGETWVKVKLPDGMVGYAHETPPADSVQPNSPPASSPGEATRSDIRASAEYEYKEIQIDINLRSNDTNVAERFEQLVMNALQKEGQDHWVPDEPTDGEALWHAGRMKWHQDNELLESVSLRLKRSKRQPKKRGIFNAVIDMLESLPRDVR